MKSICTAKFLLGEKDFKMQVFNMKCIHINVVLKILQWKCSKK